MKLRGIDFGHVLDASGVRAWFGEGHSYHHLVPANLSFLGSTFVAKTTTLNARAGNARMSTDGLKTKLWQDCVKVYWREGAVLNAFGLPGPGFAALLAQGRWQRLTKPFFLSFMAIEQSRDRHLDEVKAFVQMLKRERHNFLAPFGLQINFSCPNVHPNETTTEFEKHLDEYATLGIPLMVKFSATTEVSDALRIAAHDACDGICISNSIPWGTLGDQINWSRFGNESPLKKYGNGGLSGKPLLPIVEDWVRRARAGGYRGAINAGGGILKPRDVDRLVDAGADSVFIGSIAMLRPMRVQATIDHANRLYASQSSEQTSGVLMRA
jgi:dihydroorotate dehydrogenase